MSPPLGRRFCSAASHPKADPSGLFTPICNMRGWVPFGCGLAALRDHMDKQVRALGEGVTVLVANPGWKLVFPQTGSGGEKPPAPDPSPAEAASDFSGASADLSLRAFW